MAPTPIYGKDTLRQAKWNEYKSKLEKPVRPLYPGPGSFQHYQLKLDPQKDAATYNLIDRGRAPNDPPIETLTTLKHVVVQKGNAPAGGFPLYIAFHGGGATSTGENDNEWASMVQCYQGRIKDGIWISVRGVGDTWDLHFRPAGYVLVERLIQQMVLFNNVNSNRVYLIGFSAGGDGCFRLAPRLAQRLAGINIGGGDPGVFPSTNLMNVPTCLQVGEWDNPHWRCMHVAQKNDELDKLQAAYRDLVKPQATNAYVHNTFIHPGANHNDWEQSNFWNSNPDETIAAVRVIQDVGDWLSKYNEQTNTPTVNLPTYSTNTNAIDWLSTKVRKPIPIDVVWDMSIKPGYPGYNDNFFTEVLSNMTGRNQNYWLTIDNQDSTVVGPVIKARIDPANNSIVVFQAQKYVRILLRLNMWDTTKPIKVSIGGQTIITPVPREENLTVIKQTLMRNDPELVFNGDIILTQASSGKWLATQTQ